MTEFVNIPRATGHTQDGLSFFANFVTLDWTSIEVGAPLCVGGNFTCQGDEWEVLQTDDSCWCRIHANGWDYTVRFGTTLEDHPKSSENSAPSDNPTHSDQAWMSVKAAKGDTVLVRSLFLTKDPEHPNRYTGSQDGSEAWICFE